MHKDALLVAFNHSTADILNIINGYRTGVITAELGMDTIAHILSNLGHTTENLIDRKSDQKSD